MARVLTVCEVMPNSVARLLIPGAHMVGAIFLYAMAHARVRRLSPRQRGSGARGHTAEAAYMIRPRTETMTICVQRLEVDQFSGVGPIVGSIPVDNATFDHGSFIDEA